MQYGIVNVINRIFMRWIQNIIKNDIFYQERANAETFGKNGKNLNV